MSGSPEGPPKGSPEGPPNGFPKGSPSGLPDAHYYTSSDGLRLFYRTYGERNRQPPVLCLPGLTRNSRDFHSLARLIAAEHWVICPDFRGRGRSDRDPNYLNYVPRTYVSDIVALMDSLQMDPAVFIGTSLGGIVAMITRAAHPDRVAAVVLNDIGPEINPAGLERIRSFAGQQPPVASWREAAEQAKATHGAALPGLNHEEWQAFARNLYREDEGGTPVLDMDPKIGDASREAPVAAGDPWAIWKPMDGIPTLVLRGETSDILSFETVLRMQATHAQLAAVTVPDRGHAPLLDEPVALRAITRFLEELRQ